MKDFFQLIKTLKPYRRDVILAILFNILYSIFTVVSIPILIPFFQLLFNRSPMDNNSSKYLRWILDRYMNFIDQFGQERTLIILCLSIVFVFFLKNLCRYLATYFTATFRTGVVYDFRQKLFNKYLHLPYAEYINFKVGDSIARITTDVQYIENSILKVIDVVFKAPLIIIGSVFIMIQISPKLSLFVILLILITLFILGGISKTLKSTSSDAQEKISNMASIVEESISGIKEIKSFVAEKAMIKRFDKENISWRNSYRKLIRRKELSSPLSEFIGVSIMLLLMYYGALLVIKGELSPATFFAFIIAFYQVIDPAKTFNTALFNIQQGMASFNRIEDFLSLDYEKNNADIENHISFENQLSIENITYTYGDRLVLDDISFTVHKGEKVAIVGASGSGKTTLINVITGLVPLQSGDITMDGQSIMNTSVYQWRKLFGVVSQNPFIFNQTVKYNVNLDHEPRVIKDHLETANALEFTEKLPKKEDTLLGEKGMKLSGGQRQRVTIARALASDAEILVMDEATSSLDSASEKIVQKAIDDSTYNKTSIIIAHRLSSVMNADKIIVIDQGKIESIGKHEQLLNSSPTYKRMIALQQLTD